MNRIEEMYEERIAHLRTALKMADEDIRIYKGMLGVPVPSHQSTVVDAVLGQDTERSIEQDKFRARHA